MDWLPHLKEAVPKRGYGNRLSMYLISLEAWRRGLGVKYYKMENPENKMLIRYSIYNDNREHFFESSRGDKLTEQAFELCENKDETKKCLKKVGVPVPEGRRFKADQTNIEILEYARELGYPVVIKPVSENAGKGVFSNIKSEPELSRIVEHVRETLKYKDIIIEEYVAGVEYRIFLVDGEVYGIVNRIPANIVGDGENSIKKLIELKNESKKSNPNISSKLIEVDKEVLDNLDSLGYDLNSVPPKSELIYLRHKSNVSAGGDPIDVTDELPEPIKDIAKKAFRAISGLDLCGLDMIIDKKTNQGVVIEINTKPMIGLHVFPTKGKPRDVVTPIVDYYFPETRNVEKTDLYFDFTAALAPLRRGVTKQVIVTPPSSTKTTHKCCLLISNIDRKLVSWIRKESLTRGLNGFIKEVKEKQYRVVLASFNKTNLNNAIESITRELDEIVGLKYKKIPWEEPVKIGFEISYISENKKTILKLEKKLRNEKKENKKNKKTIKKIKKESLKKQNRIEELQKRIVYAEKKYNNIINSKSWRITRPLRVFMKLFK